MFNIPLHFLVDHLQELLVSYSNGYYVAKVISLFSSQWTIVQFPNILYSSWMTVSFMFNNNLNFWKQVKKIIDIKAKKLNIPGTNDNLLDWVIQNCQYVELDMEIICLPRMRPQIYQSNSKQFSIIFNLPLLLISNYLYIKWFWKLTTLGTTYKIKCKSN